MSDFTYKDYIPANARVIVDYSAKEGDKVKFSYPRDWTYKKAVWGAAFSNVFQFWVMLHLRLIVILIYPILIVWGGYRLWSGGFAPLTKPTSEVVFVPSSFESFGFGLFLVAYAIGIPAIATFILSLKKEWLSWVIPKMGHATAFLSGSMKQVEFKPQDVVDNKAIIPIFSNVFLGYKSSEEFSKYLTKVEILELPFNYVRRKPVRFWKWDKVKNDFKFRCVFYFSETPKTGSLLVEFD